MEYAWPVRVSTKAIIVQDGKLLAVKHHKDEEFYTLPGGGTNAGESSRQGLERECLEEVGARVRVGALRYVRDYVADNHEFALAQAGFHQVELMFTCELLTGDFVDPSEPDTHQVGVEWLPLDRLEEFPLYPLTLRKYLKKGRDGGDFDGPVYLGDVN